MKECPSLAVFALGMIAISLGFAQETPYAYSTLAGRALTPGTADGPVATARFDRPFGVAVDGAGNVYVSDAVRHTVRKITPGGVVSTLAGQAGTPGLADGSGTVALFGGTRNSDGTSTTTGATGPFGLALTPTGLLLVADAHNHVVRGVTADGAVSRFVGDPGRPGYTDTDRGSLFLSPYAVAVDASGDAYVADTFNQVIRRVSTTGVVTTIAGSAGNAASFDGIGAAARFVLPTAITISRSGTIFVLDGANVVRRLTRFSGVADTWEVTTLAGKPFTGGTADGTGADAQFSAVPANANTVTLYTSRPPDVTLPFFGSSYQFGGLVGITVDAGENVFVADGPNNTIRRITPAGVVTTIGGATTAGSTDGVAPSARFYRPAGIAVDDAGVLYIADSLNSTIRRGARAAAPTIQMQPIATAAGIGETVTLSVAATASPLPSYQWRRNGTVLAGATSASLTLTNVQVTQGGTYTVVASNSLGSITSEGALLTVTAAPIITLQPAGVIVEAGRSFTLRVTAAASPAPSYQWTRGGAALPGATNSTLTTTSAQAASAGEYRVIISNAFGSITSNAAVVVVNTGRIGNLSIRTALNGREPLIVGFVVSGGSKPLLVRAIGPALQQFGVGTAMADPQLSLQAGSTVLATNDNWSTAANAAQIAAAASQVGGFALAAGSLDAAALINVATAVTAQSSSRDGAGGVVLLELYDAGPTGLARLINVSTRAQVGVDENALFAGFSVSGNSPRTLLIRAIGPTLGAFGVTGVLLDPFLEVFDAGATRPRATNDNWGGSATLSATFSRVGAFALPATTSRDSVIMASFTPGTYAAKVSGVGNTTGEVLLEIYEIP